MVLPVGAHLQRRVRHERPPRALDREPAAEQARPAAVGNEPVALDPDRELRLGHLDRDVRRRRRRVAEPVVAVGGRPRAPGADDELEVDERLAVGTARPRRSRASCRPPPPPARGRGISCASAPFTASNIRKPVTPRIVDAAGITTCATVPGFVTTFTGRNAPDVVGISELTADMTAW